MVCQDCKEMRKTLDSIKKMLSVRNDDEIEGALYKWIKKSTRVIKHYKEKPQIVKEDVQLA